MHRLFAQIPRLTRLTCWRRSLGAPLLAAALALAAGCGGSDFGDLPGLYEVQSHTVNDTGCDAEGPEVDEFTHFILREDEFLGQEFLSLGECESAAEETCNDAGIFSAFIAEDGQLVNRITFSSGGGEFSCALGMTEGIMEELEDGSVRITTQVYSEEDDTLSEVQCDPEEAERRGTSMPCESLEVLLGAPI